MKGKVIGMIGVYESDIEMLRQAAASKDFRQYRIAQEAVNLGRLLLLKNADYGDSAAMEPYLCPGMLPSAAIRVRMSDKIQRLRSLLGSGKAMTDESVTDTVRDLAGYCVLFLASEGTDAPEGVLARTNS